MVISFVAFDAHSGGCVSRTRAGFVTRAPARWARGSRLGGFFWSGGRLRISLHGLSPCGQLARRPPTPGCALPCDPPPRLDGEATHHGHGVASPPPLPIGRCETVLDKYIYTHSPHESQGRRRRRTAPLPLVGTGGCRKYFPISYHTFTMVSRTRMLTPERPAPPAPDRPFRLGAQTQPRLKAWPSTSVAVWSGGERIPGRCRRWPR